MAVPARLPVTCAVFMIPIATAVRSNDSRFALALAAASAIPSPNCRKLLKANLNCVCVSTSPMRPSFSSTFDPSIESPRLLNTPPMILATCPTSPLVTVATLLATSLPTRAADSDSEAELSSYWISSSSASLDNVRLATSRVCRTERSTAAAVSPSSAFITVLSRMVCSSSPMAVLKMRPATYPAPSRPAAVPRRLPRACCPTRDCLRCSRCRWPIWRVASFAVRENSRCRCAAWPISTP